MIKSYIKSIEYYVPKKIEYNDQNEKLTKKIGINQINVVEEETATDLAFMAAEKLFESGICEREHIDFIIFCTQSPDYFLPTSACLLQARLELPTKCGAFDYNLGCSGYVYGLSLAKGLIETGQAENILLLTGDTYSKYVNKKDQSVKVLFGDAGSATLISNVNANEDYLGPFVFGTDGTGKENLIVRNGGAREPYTEEALSELEDRYGNLRSNANLYMNGPEVFNFTLREVPPAFFELLEKTGMAIQDYDRFVFHQANKFMLEHLRLKLKIPEEKFTVCLENYGNTVSSTIPIALKNEMEQGNLDDNNKLLLLGFGVGYSWAGCKMVWKNS